MAQSHSDELYQGRIDGIEIRIAWQDARIQAYAIVDKRVGRPVDEGGQSLE